jgi:hypothetical protein
MQSRDEKSSGTRTNAKRWSRDDDERMLAAIKKHGSSCWKIIAGEVKTKSHHACCMHFPTLPTQHTFLSLTSLLAHEDTCHFE